MTNMMITIRRAASTKRRGAACACIIAALATCGAVSAQDSGGAAMSAGRYEVEIIVFRNLDQRGNTAEVSSPSPQLPLAGTPVTALPGSWPALEPAALDLAPLAARLRKSGAYQVLYHGGWTQSVERENRAVASPLPAEATGAGVSGSIKLYRERYLHALVDIALQTPDGPANESQHIRQGRRLRGQAIQYFDNPALGVIVSARPLDGGVGADPDAAAPVE